MTADPPAHPLSLKKPKRMRSTALLGALAGMLLALLASELVRAGYFQRWEKFAAPHPHAVEILWGDEQTVQVRITQEFSLLWLSENSIWIKSKPKIEPPRQPCSSVPAAFNPLALPPYHRVDCAVFEYPRGDTITTVIYALDKQGVLWQWERTRSGLDWVTFPIIAFWGGVLGLLVVSILGSIRKWRKRNAAQDRPEEPSK